jgi:hypothetical protein
VLERRGDQILFHPRLLELSAHYHFAPQPCQVRAANQKGRVERAIRYVRDSFWAGRTFTTLAECNRQAWAWRDEVAHQRRWPGDDDRTVAEVFAEEQARLLSPPLHPFSTDRMEAVRSHKTIYVRFDLNDYSIPPEAVGRPLTLVASDTVVRILDGTAEIARHQRSYDRPQLVLEPAHQEALLNSKRKAFHATPASLLEQLIPESKTLLDVAFAQASPDFPDRFRCEMDIGGRLGNALASIELAQSQAPQHNAHRLHAAVQQSIQLIPVALFQVHT